MNPAVVGDQFQDLAHATHVLLSLQPHHQPQLFILFYKYLSFLGCWEPNPGSHIGKTSALPLSYNPQLFIYFFHLFFKIIFFPFWGRECPQCLGASGMKLLVSHLSGPLTLFQFFPLGFLTPQLSCFSLLFPEQWPGFSSWLGTCWTSTLTQVRRYIYPWLTRECGSVTTSCNAGVWVLNHWVIFPSGWKLQRKCPHHLGLCGPTSIWTHGLKPDGGAFKASEWALAFCS